MPYNKSTPQRFLKNKKKFRATQRMQSFFRRKGIVLIIIAIALFLCVYGVFRSRLLQIRTIQVNGIYENEALSRETEKMKGRNFLLFNNEKYEAHLVKTFPELAEITVSKKFPNTVYVRLDRRVPVALLVSLEFQESTESGQIATNSAVPLASTSKYFIDKYGVPFAAIDETGITAQTATASTLGAQSGSLATLYLIEKEPVMLGTSLESSFVNQALRIQELSARTPFRFLQFRQVSSTSFEAKTDDNAVILFSTTRSVDEQLAALQILYESSTIDRKKARKIDVRFQKTVLVP